MKVLRVFMRCFHISMAFTDPLVNMLSSNSEILIIFLDTECREGVAMGYLRTKSFLIFSDPDAPVEGAADPQKVAELEAAHEQSKKRQIDDQNKRFLKLLREIALSAKDRAALKETRQTIYEMTIHSSVKDEIASKNHDEPESLPDFLLTEAQIKAQIKAKADAETEAKADAETEAKAKAALKEAQTKLDDLEKRAQSQKLDPAIEPRLHELVRIVQDLGADEEESLKEYLLTTFPSAAEAHWRTHAWALVAISKAKMPDTQYVPHRTGDNTVRLRPDGCLGVNLRPEGWTTGLDPKPDGSTHPSPWFKVVESCSEGGNWGGYLQISSVADNGKYLDSSDTWGRLVTDDINLHTSVNFKDDGNGWAAPASSKTNKVMFYDKGNYYEIWQVNGNSKRPLTVVNNQLKFVADATPGKWNLQDSTWD